MIREARRTPRVLRRAPVLRTYGPNRTGGPGRAVPLRIRPPNPPLRARADQRLCRAASARGTTVPVRYAVKSSGCW